MSGKGNGSEAREPGASAGLVASGIRLLIDGTLIIDGIDCTVGPGTFCALIGPNGAGKTTLLRCLAVIDTPQAGEVRFDGEELGSLPRRRRAQTVSFLEQNASTDLSLSVREVVSLGRTPYQSLWGDEDQVDQEATDQSMQHAGIAAFADRDFTSLSGGERQRVLLAKALAQDARLLLLDEPTNHLDISAQLSVLRLVSSLAGRGVSVLAALHDLNSAAAYSDRVIVMHHGRVVAAGPTATTLTADLVRTVYGVGVSVIDHPVTGRPLIAFNELNG